jgi:hypothetical protein
LDPSLVRPTSLIEQENNILIAQDIGKSYQLAVKDYNIKVRDNRIRAKDAEIKNLNGAVDFKDAQLSAYSGELQRVYANNDRLLWEVKDQGREIAQQKEDISTLEEKVEDLEQEKAAYMAELSNLCTELEASQSHIRDLKNRRLIDNILRWLRSMLPPKYAPTWIQEDRSVFPLLKCPGEIRNAIYKHALVLHHPIDFWPILPYNARGIDHLTQLTSDLKHINVSLLRVSHQVHKEAASILYACNRFRFSDRGGWTLLCGFLFHISRNSSFLTSIAANYPEWCSAKMTDAVLDESSYCLAERAAVLRLFGNTELNSPTGASSESAFAYKRAGEALMKLPNLRRVDFVVPHDVHLYAFGVELMVKAFTSQDRHLSPYASWNPVSRPIRGFVVVRREQHMRWAVGHKNLDDDVAMGRARLIALIGMLEVGMNVGVGGEIGGGGDGEREDGEARIRTARYGTVEDRMGYVLDEGEEDFDVDVPEYVEGDRSGVVKAFRGVKRWFRR